MNGFVLYNGFWNDTAVPDTVLRLCQAGAARGDTLVPRKNTSFAAVWNGDGGAVVGVGGETGICPGDVVFCFDKDTRLLTAMEAAGARVFNTAAAVTLCDDKAKTHAVLASAGMPMPQTLVAPMTYVDYTAAGDGFLDVGGKTLGFPLVVKECFGSLGEQVYLARDERELKTLAGQMKHRPFLLQEFIAESAGTDKRLYVVGDRVVAAMRRRCADDFRANIGRGGKGEAYTPTAEETALALQSCRLLGLHFGGVDILDSDRGPLLCEVNSGAQLGGITAATGVDVATEILQYVNSVI